MTFKERMTVALARSKQRHTQKQIPAATSKPIKQANITPDQYHATTLERVIAKVKIKKEMI